MSACSLPPPNTSNVTIAAAVLPSCLNKPELQIIELTSHVERIRQTIWVHGENHHIRPLSAWSYLEEPHLSVAQSEIELPQFDRKWNCRWIGFGRGWVGSQAYCLEEGGGEIMLGHIPWDSCSPDKTFAHSGAWCVLVRDLFQEQICSILGPRLWSEALV